MTADRYIYLASFSAEGRLLASRVPVLKENAKSYIVNPSAATVALEGGRKIYYLPDRIDKKRWQNWCFDSPYALAVWYLNKMEARIANLMLQADQVRATISEAQALFAANGITTENKTDE